MKKDVFGGINFCDVGILWKKKKKCGSQCFNKYFSSKSKKEDIYGNIYGNNLYVFLIKKSTL